VSVALRVALIGAGGRMGRFVTEVLGASEGFELVAALGRGDDLERELARCDARVGLDLTGAGLGALHGRLLLAAGIRPVIGTSGVTPDEASELDRRARAAGLGGLVVPNFSLGMVRLQQLATRLASEFPHVEIVETHHAGKRDAPSGTARDTALRLEAAGARRVAIHSLRLPGVFARQEVVFGGTGETVVLRHDCLGPAAFGPGILRALEHAATAVGVTCGLEHALDHT
jgi:4-hydroxy-tetrahydrodipicolinate reductase